MSDLSCKTSTLRLIMREDVNDGKGCGQRRREGAGTATNMATSMVTTSTTDDDSVRPGQPRLRVWEVTGEARCLGLWRRISSAA
ncbi:hypothetical protein FIBSPDRAFT_596880 [Athelia psychrophila]|uniref:Uncharacterized protein n=1 Tax=Athelia psychrophila TaxID=1759441 RepID=A0A166GXG9_9AGAM|nr:hypothetical protein FIBSPDRAFT_596880 [Fibularhizoctonia sp. CBS 109695]